MSTFFSGEFRHQIDEKMRIRIPAKLKEQLGEEPFITRGAEGNLIVIRKEDADEMMRQSFGNVTFADINQHPAMRVMFANGFVAEEDKQGRITLPANLIKYAQIQKNIVTIGAYKYIEIWSEENWDLYLERAGAGLKDSLRQVSESRKADK